jgi:hypothetical protein
MRTEVQKLIAAHGGIFESANLFAPYYRQLSISNLAKQKTSEKIDALVRSVPLVDVENAFNYYLKNYNNGRPIIFASHSQGTIITRQLLLDLKKSHPEVFKRTIAAYLIGYDISDAYLAKLEGALTFAKGPLDTGVIISWNTRAPDAADDPFVMIEPGAHIINPINWKTDDTYAPATASAGSFIRADDAEVNGPAGRRPHFADAQIDMKTHTLVTKAPIDPGSFWPKGILHHYDYDLYWYNFRQNVTNRIAAWQVKAK